MDTEKAERRLSEISFEKKGCHISLVGPSMGGPANGITTLVLKSLSPKGETQMSQEMIEKSAADVMITKAVAEATAALNAELLILKSEKTAAEAAKATATAAVRKAKMVAVIGEAKADETLLALKSLDEPAFDLVIKSLTVAKGVEAGTALFKELGVEGQTDPKKLAREAELNNGTMQYLKSQFTAKK